MTQRTDAEASGRTGVGRGREGVLHRGNEGVLESKLGRAERTPTKERKRVVSWREAGRRLLAEENGEGQDRPFRRTASFRLAADL